MKKRIDGKSNVPLAYLELNGRVFGKRNIYQKIIKSRPSQSNSFTPASQPLMNKPQALEGNCAPLSPSQTIITPETVHNYLPCEGPAQFSAVQLVLNMVLNGCRAPPSPPKVLQLIQLEVVWPDNKDSEKVTAERKSSLQKNAKLETKKKRRNVFLSM